MTTCQGLTLRQALLSGTSKFLARTSKNSGLYADLTHNLSQTVTKITVGQVMKKLNVKPSLFGRRLTYLLLTFRHKWWIYCSCFLVTLIYYILDLSLDL